MGAPSVSFSMQGELQKMSLGMEEMETLLRQHALEKNVREKGHADVAVTSVAHMVYMDVTSIDRAVVRLPLVYTLGIFSAVSVGLTVHLWSYHKVIQGLPSSGVQVRHAATLLPLERCKNCLLAGVIASQKSQHASPKHESWLVVVLKSEVGPCILRRASGHCKRAIIRAPK